ncbi:MAG: metal-dependent transcriptional regulator [Candidatus Roseilinea sp.]|uniref:metal-dependent transcriptional regulator n=1 Tax=Candidatus Roseilinea sp. TaxID=2838777 RepID=UPI00404B9808
MSDISALSESIQDYLKTIFALRMNSERVTTNAIAVRLDVAAASVTGMLKRLASMQLVEYERYQGVRLTPAGEKIALEVIRHHRLIELYLMEAMGYSWDQVHDEAERMEHAISEAFEERMAQLLGDPKIDPHGNPIPTKDGNIASCSRRRLSQVGNGETVRIERIQNEDPALLRHIAALGLMPGADLTVIQQSTSTPSGSVTVVHKTSGHKDDQPLHLERAIADHIFVYESQPA